MVSGFLEDKLNAIAQFAYTLPQLTFPLITQFVDFYSKIYTQTQPIRFKQLRHHFVGKLFKPAIVNLLNVVVCHQPDK